MERLASILGVHTNDRMMMSKEWRLCQKHADHSKGRLGDHTKGRHGDHAKGVTMTKKWRLILKHNQSLKGIMRSTVPLPCFFDVKKSHRVARERPRQGTKFCRMGRNSVLLSIYPSVRPSVCPSAFRTRGLRASWRGLRASWRRVCQ